MHPAPSLRVGACLLATMTSASCARAPDASPPPDAITIHEQAVVIDAHAHPNVTQSGSAAPSGGGWDIEVDLGPMTEGGLDAVFFSVPLLVEEGDREPASVRIFADVGSIMTEVERVGDRAEMAFTPEDIERIHSGGKLAVLLGIEVGDPLGGELALLERYHATGIRMITLGLPPERTPGSSQVDPDDPPLSPFGHRVVEEMNRLGLIIDISHMPDRQQMDIIRTSSAPVVASHSNARALLDVPREIPDSIIRAVAEKDGLVCVTFHPGHLSDDPSDSPGTVEILVDHIDHIVRVAGIDHVGFGSDFIGGGTETVGLESAAGLPSITNTLVERGYSSTDIGKVLGGNLLRVLGVVQQQGRNPDSR